MKKIKLTQEQYALVDDEDFERLNQWRWSCFKRENYTSYAVRGADNKTIYMHREVLGTKKGLLTDHIDGNGLNNQKNNLRIATHSQNQANRRPNKISSSGMVGVYPSGKVKKPWKAQYSKNNKWLYIGCFETKEEAQDAYNEVIIRERGVFALNPTKI